MKRVTIYLKSDHLRQLKTAIMMDVAHERPMLKYEKHQSTIMPSFVFEVRRGKTIICEECA